MEKEKDIIDELINSLKNKDPLIRRSAAETLGRIGDVRAVEPLAFYLGLSYSGNLILSGQN
ncbi:MAG: HEAT repeat domain-containing protein [Candidatus Jordarchaeaceae archaeon]